MLLSDLKQKNDNIIQSIVQISDYVHGEAYD